MFPTLQIDSFYTSEDNIIESFLRPVLMEAVSYDRVSAYFTAGALAAYADGLEMFGFAGHKYRLIVSKDISPEDFTQIQIGVAIRKSLTDEMLKDLRAIDSLAVEKGLSNLARLLALGIVEIKIAFKRSGIFHDKFGILKDEMGNRIKFTGSNNETVAAISSNHESFSVVCSWMDKNGFYTRGIDKSQRLFEAYWRGGYGQILVRDVDDILLQEIMRHDKGKMIEEAMLLKENACILDIQDGRLYLQLNLPDNGERLKGRGFVRIKLRRYLDKKGLEHVGKIVFKEALEYVQFKEIDKLLRKKIPEEGYSYVMTERLHEQIEAKDIHIAERSTLGLDIKRRDKRIKERFDEFASVVDKRLERRLRERQMWDAFFMMSMRKSGNFSVPGSGKTSSVLGMFAFLQEKAGIKRILQKFTETDTNYIEPQKYNFTVMLQETNTVEPTTTIQNPLTGEPESSDISSVRPFAVMINNIKHLLAKYPYRIIRSQWSGKIGKQFAATLKVVGNDDIGIVANITSLINKEGDTMLRSVSINSTGSLFEGYLVIGINSLDSLDQLIKKIKNLKGVKDVQRATH